MSSHASKRRARGELRKVTAIVRSDLLERVERRLQELRAPGITVTKVRGYGEYENFFARDRMTQHSRVEIFLRRERAEDVARAIVEAAHTGGAGDGLVAVLPDMHRVRRAHSADLPPGSRAALRQRRAERARLNGAR